MLNKQQKQNTQKQTNYAELSDVFYMYVCTYHMYVWHTYVCMYHTYTYI